MRIKHTIKDRAAHVLPFVQTAWKHNWDTATADTTVKAMNSQERCSRVNQTTELLVLFERGSFTWVHRS